MTFEYTKYVSQYKVSLFTRLLQWFVNLKLDCTWIPISHILFTVFISFLSIQYLKTFLALPIVRCIVLSGFNLSCHFVAHSKIQFRSFCKTSPSSRFCTSLNNLVSSAIQHTCSKYSLKLQHLCVQGNTRSARVPIQFLEGLIRY